MMISRCSSSSSVVTQVGRRACQLLMSDYYNFYCGVGSSSRCFRSFQSSILGSGGLINAFSYKVINTATSNSDSSSNVVKLMLESNSYAGLVATRSYSTTVIKQSPDEGGSDSPKPRRKLPARRGDTGGVSRKVVLGLDSSSSGSSGSSISAAAATDDDDEDISQQGKLEQQKLIKIVRSKNNDKNNDRVVEEDEKDNLIESAPAAKKAPRKKKEGSVTASGEGADSKVSSTMKSIGITKTERHAKKSDSSSSGGKKDTATVVDYGWNWVPPSKSLKTGTGADANIEDLFPVLPGVLLTFEEVQAALTRLGGENILQVELNRPVDDLNKLIIVTGNSTRHLQKMAEVVVKSLKARKLKQAPGYTGAEGGAEDDWVIVDCYNFAVSLMLAEARQAFNLESFANEADDESEYMPKSATDDKNYDAEFDKWLAKYPNNFYDQRSTVQKDKDADEPGGFHKL